MPSTTDTGEAPASLRASGRQSAAWDRQNDDLLVIDATTLAVAHTLSLDFDVAHLDISADSETVLVAGSDVFNSAPKGTPGAPVHLAAIHLPSGAQHIATLSGATSVRAVEERGDRSQFWIGTNAGVGYVEVRSSRISTTPTLAGHTAVLDLHHVPGTSSDVAVLFDDGTVFAGPFYGLQHVFTLSNVGFDHRLVVVPDPRPAFLVADRSLRLATIRPEVYRDLDLRLRIDDDDGEGDPGAGDEPDGDALQDDLEAALKDAESDGMLTREEVTSLLVYDLPDSVVDEAIDLVDAAFEAAGWFADSDAMKTVVD